MPPVWTGVEKIGDVVLTGGDLVGGVGSIGFTTAATGCAIATSGDLVTVESPVVEAADVSIESEVVADSAVVTEFIGFNDDASEIRLLIVGGNGFGIGFSTGLVRPSLISCTIRLNLIKSSFSRLTINVNP